MMEQAVLGGVKKVIELEGGVGLGEDRRSGRRVRVLLARHSWCPGPMVIELESSMPLIISLEPIAESRLFERLGTLVLACRVPESEVVVRPTCRPVFLLHPNHPSIIPRLHLFVAHQQFQVSRICISTLLMSPKRLRPDSRIISLSSPQVNILAWASSSACVGRPFTSSGGGWTEGPGYRVSPSYTIGSGCRDILVI